MALYSRDLAAQALRDLDSVLKAIVEGTFVPDAGRSGYFVSASSEPQQPLFQPVAKHRVAKDSSVPSAPKEPAPAISAQDEDGSDMDSTESSSSSSEGEDDGLEADESLAAASGAPIRSASRFAGQEIFQHVMYGTLHRTHLEVEGKLACSRVIGPRYRAFQGSAVDWARCNTCFGSGPFSLE